MALFYSRYGFIPALVSKSSYETRRVVGLKTSGMGLYQNCSYMRDNCSLQVLPQVNKAYTRNIQILTCMILIGIACTLISHTLSGIS